MVAVDRAVTVESGPFEIFKAVSDSLSQLNRNLAHTNAVSVVVVSAAVVPIRHEHTELIRLGASPQAVT